MVLFIPFGAQPSRVAPLWPALVAYAGANGWTLSVDGEDHLTAHRLANRYEVASRLAHPELSRRTQTAYQDFGAQGTFQPVAPDEDYNSIPPVAIVAAVAALVIALIWLTR